MKKVRNYLRNLLTIILCYVFSLIRVNARIKLIEQPNSIIFFHEGKLGDMVCATPLFRAVKQRFPKCRVIVFGNSVNKELMQGNNDVDEYVVFTRDALIGNISKLKKYKADFACLLTPSATNLACLYLGGIPAIVVPRVEKGHSPYYTKSYRFLKRLVRDVPHYMGSYAPREYLRLLEPIGIKTEDTTKHLFFSREAELKVIQILKESGVVKGETLVCISPSAGNAIKRWPPERFAEVVSRILKEYSFKVVLIGGQGDKESCKIVMEYNKPYSSRIINLCGSVNIDELKALISKMSVFISVDTGPIYIAEAFMIPTIDIIGPIDENEQPPRGDRHINVTAERRRPQLFVLNAREYDPVEARRQVENISVENVMDAFIALLPNIHAYS